MKKSKENLDLLRKPPVMWALNTVPSSSLFCVSRARRTSVLLICSLCRASNPALVISILLPPQHQLYWLPDRKQEAQTASTGPASPLAAHQGSGGKTRSAMPPVWPPERGQLNVPSSHWLLEVEDSLSLAGRHRAKRLLEDLIFLT